MRFGLVTPIVTRHPQHDAPWTEDAGPREIAAIACAADRLGFHHLTCSEHVAIPTDVAAARGTRYYDPLATFGYLAAQTTRIRFVTHVLVLGYHHPLEIAKRYGTLDRISDGRLVLGVGVGTLEEEFRLLGARFAGRGPVFEDAVAALRASFGRRAPCFEGPHHRFADIVVDPCGLQAAIPIWIGGRSARSLRRALVLGDGWDPFGLDADALEALLTRARTWREWQVRATPLTLVLPVDGLFDLTLAPEREAFVARAERHRRMGTTVLNVRLSHRSLAHYLEQLEILARDVAPTFA